MTVTAVVREKVVIALRKSNPCATLEEIGGDVGVTRERVRQILNKANLPTKKYITTYLCNHCGDPIPRRRTYQNPKFCSTKCYSAYSRIQIACTFCGTLKEYRAKEVTWKIENRGRSSSLFFCSKQCQGKWFGKNYGRQLGDHTPRSKGRKYNDEEEE